MPSIPLSKIEELKDLYYAQKLHLIDLARYFGVSIHSVVYFMDKHKLRRRSISESRRINFIRKLPSYIRRDVLNKEDELLQAMGVMLYWAEGTKNDSSTSLDFANSDSAMVVLFVTFLRRIFRIDGSKLRVYLYCYADQEIQQLIKFWSSVTHIPISQFTRPHVRSEVKKGGRKMLHGMVHIRYSDKKLLSEIKKMIECYSLKRFDI